MAVDLTIIGLEQIGASIGLALADKSLEITRTGYDDSHITATRAEKAGAVDRTSINIHAAVEKADLVILAVPEGEVREILELIKDDLKPDSLVMDTSLLKTASTAWAADLLPEKRYFIGFTPVIGARYLDESAAGIEAAHPDLFKNSAVLITTPPSCNPDSVRVASELAGILGCSPLFIDAQEAEGLLAAVCGLPWLVSAALVNATTGQPGWQEARKLAGKAFTRVSEPLLNMDGTKQFGQSAILNPVNTARVLDNLIVELQTMRDMIKNGDGENLDQLLHNAGQQRQEWLTQRKAANWERRPTSADMPGRMDTFTHLFGLKTKKPKKE